ncbi:hypothetical protein ACGFIK_14360 [Micromonospora sp. NPDC048871]|uniref:hypothetical protein n=1 Tax=unclassified Micromonospora TaxID=2617518 RepID=UPI002E0D7EE7|nr:hypothetical protein OIE53_11300 [Micromonospora sp. NBC_01739]
MFARSCAGQFLDPVCLPMASPIARTWFRWTAFSTVTYGRPDNDSTPALFARSATSSVTAHNSGCGSATGVRIAGVEEVAPRMASATRKRATNLRTGHDHRI